MTINFNYIKTRNVKNKEPNTYDLPAFDVLRSRDRGMKFILLKFLKSLKILISNNL